MLTRFLNWLGNSNEQEVSIDSIVGEMQTVLDLTPADQSGETDVIDDLFCKFEKLYPGLRIQITNRVFAAVRGTIFYQGQKAHFSLMLVDEVSQDSIPKEEQPTEVIEIPLYLLEKLHVVSHSFAGYPDSDLSKTVEGLLMSHKERAR